MSDRTAKDRVLDWLLAAWVALAGLWFLVTPMELWPGGRYVYALVLASGVVGAVLRLVNRPGRNG